LKEEIQHIVFLKLEGDKMECVYCGHNTHVTDKRDAPEGIRRRRECLRFRKRFTTYERPDVKDIIVVKKDKRREGFSKEKLKNGLMRACEKRPISVQEIDKIVDEIEEKLRRKGKEIKGEMIGKMVMNKLKKLDKIAYIRFASVYRDFQDIQEFKEEMKEL
jgi:transcriptional repressor NrdR